MDELFKMSLFLIILLHIVYTPFYVEAFGGNIQFREHVGIKAVSSDIAITPNQFENVASTLVCVTKCTISPSCSSFNYNPILRICQLIMKSDLLSYILEETTSWIFATLEVIMCQQPQAAIGLVDSIENPLVGVTASHHCDGNEYAAGQTKQICQPSGEWLPLALFTCTPPADCGPLTDPGNGLVTLNNNGATTEASTASYSCNSGFVMTVGTSNVECTSSGSWESSAGGAAVTVTCSADCGPLTDPGNGLVTLNNNGATTAGSTATYSCNSRFTLMAGTANVQCTSSGSWESSAGGAAVTVTCSADCGPLTNPSNGLVTLNNNGATTEGSTATYSCNSGFTLTGGTVNVLCTNSGDWESSAGGAAVTVTCNGCNNNWSLFGNVCIGIISQEKSWSNAKVECQNRGIRLATIRDFETHQFIKTLAEGYSYQYFWIGLNDYEQEGVWKWLTGEQATYFLWGSRSDGGSYDNPDGGTSQQCVSLGQSYSYKWVDAPCNWQSYFVCEDDPI